MRGIRTRLAITLVVLVALTVAAIGIGVYAFVEASLRDRLLADARHQADFNLSVLLPAEVPPPTDAPSFAASGLPEAFKLRGDVDTIADFGDGNPYTPAGLLGALDQLSPDLRELVGEGQLGYAWQTLQGQPVLVVGGRQGASPDLFFVFPAADVEAALAQLRLGLVAAGLLAVLVALITAGFIARGILRPVDAAARRGANDRRGRPHGAGARGRARRVRALGRRVQPDGRHARDDRRPARERAAAEPAVRRGRLARAPDAAHRAGRRGVADRERHRGDDAGRAARGRAPRRRHPPAAGARRRADGDLALRRGRRAAEPRAGRPRARRVGGRGGRACRRPRSPCRRARSWWSPIPAASTGSWATSSTTPATTRPTGRSRCP